MEISAGPAGAPVRFSFYLILLVHITYDMLIRKKNKFKLILIVKIDLRSVFARKDQLCIDTSIVITSKTANSYDMISKK